MNIFGRRRDERRDAGQAGQQITDEQALERYRYMLSTAPPEDIERAHEEAFARLTPDQRRQALQALAGVVPASEIRGDDPASLARTATRAEIRQPGTIERVWGTGAGPGMGGWFLSTLAASFIGTAIAQSFFDNDAGYDQGSQQTADQGSDTGEGDTADFGGDDYGGDTGDTGDFGGGDFGGGDFGGGDFGGGDFGGI
ncbi:MAG TPA: hypothetical protein VF253_05925 [Candidatus Limnocylindrales bacterium]